MMSRFETPEGTKACRRGHVKSCEFWLIYVQCTSWKQLIQLNHCWHDACLAAAVTDLGDLRPGERLAALRPAGEPGAYSE